MALCRFEAKIISRSGGRSTIGAAAYRSGKSVTASAAYRHGDAVKDERTGVTYDYTRKRGVMGSEIMLPDDAPDWMRDRGQLWNSVEKVEKRADAQLARDHILTLPHELTAEQRRDLTREFVQAQFVDKGYVADIAWHAPHGKGDERNFHAHVMVVMRKADENGFARKKERPPEGKHPADHWKAELRAQREAWANAGADKLKEAGFEIEAIRFRAGHMTIEKQREAAIARGDLIWAERLDREAEPKQGPLATKLEREGRESHAGNDRRAAQARNAERAELNAEQAAVSAEIIDLERRRKMDGEELTDERLKLQAQREAETLAAAKAQKERLAGYETQKQQEADAAKQDQQKRRQADERRAAEGDITSAQGRYAQALGQHYDIRDPYGSLARAAMAEYGQFHRQREELRKEIAATKDPQEREALQLRQRIEGCEYMAITSQRIAGISAVVAGREDAPQAKLDRERAEFWQQEAAKAREQRAQLMEARQMQQQQQPEQSGNTRDTRSPREFAGDRMDGQLSSASREQTRPQQPPRAPDRAENARGTVQQRAEPRPVETPPQTIDEFAQRRTRRTPRQCPAGKSPARTRSRGT